MHGTTNAKSIVSSMICKCELLGLNRGQGINWLLQVNTVLMIGFEVFTGVKIYCLMNYDM